MMNKFKKNLVNTKRIIKRKINSLYISFVLGVSIGAQPIIGFNYGAGNLLRVISVKLND